ncbi:hypothetical protein AC579_1674 [Pseudocercospora musae]|uniref:BTB domain-containing protein n=1 Tax=Pseudocercospora musae TaxID=113226 RepID=A0A139I9I0_9PEZI|nr:hypothetical protein AC579_1674 [Pseudocercospora musae]
MATGNQSSGLLKRIVGLHGDKRYADLTICCGERRWKVHKAIVCGGCKFFEKACDGRFKEATNNTVTLEDDSPNGVAAMLRYLYTEDYDDTSDQERCAPLLFNIHYDLPDLVKLATQKFQSRMKVQSLHLIELADAICETYKFETDPQASLRQCLMDHVMGSGQHLLKDNAFIQVVKGVPAFAAELVAETFRQNKQPGEPRYRCRHCSEAFLIKKAAFARIVCKIMCPHCGKDNIASSLRKRRVTGRL